MLRRDLITKQVEQMARAIAIMLGLRNEGRNAEARQKADEMLKEFTGMDAASLNIIPQEELMSTLREEIKLHEDQVSVVADYFMIEGEMLSEEENDEAAQECFSKALCLFEGLNKLPKATFSMERMQKIRTLKQYLGK
jgi:hypothetical protein